MPKYKEAQLGKAVKYAQDHPDIPLTRVAILHDVNLSTLRRRKLGLTLPPSQAHRHRQLFSPGEEKAIAKHCILMADHNFPISHELLRRLAQDILNSRCESQIHHHEIGEDWVDRFLSRNPEIRMKFTRYQERSRLAVSNNIELQLDFLRQLANLVRRLKVREHDIWNCDEKGITIGQQSMKTKVIVRAGVSKAIAGCDGNREFVSVLETVSAAGRIIPPFIVWTGKVHTESYYPRTSHQYEGTFAVSPSGYMDNELGMEYMKQHFEPHTRRIAVIDGKEVVQTRILIVDGHASHLNYSMLSWALDKNIHVICLPSKSTHILQPLDVGCFGLLQRLYERNLGDWVIANPLGLVNKVPFLEILFKTRLEVYTTEIIQSAWKASYCWPIDIDLARSRGMERIANLASLSNAAQPTNQANLANPANPANAIAGAHSGVLKPTANVSDRSQTEAIANPNLDTPYQLRHLEKKFTEAVPLDCSARKVLLDSFFAYADTANEKVCKHRDIAPRAHTLNALRNGKTRMRVPAGRRHIPGAGRVMTGKVIASGLQQLEEAEAKKAEKQQLAEERKRAAERKRERKLAAERQWKMEKTQYEIEKNIWEMDCRLIEEKWQTEREAAKVAKVRIPKKPKLPPRPQKPIKANFDNPASKTNELLAVSEGDDDASEANQSGNEMDGITEGIRQLEIEQFAAVRSTASLSSGT